MSGVEQGTIAPVEHRGPVHNEKVDVVVCECRMSGEGIAEMSPKIFWEAWLGMASVYQSPPASLRLTCRLG
jgi:hypothetical protein